MGLYKGQKYNHRLLYAAQSRRYQTDQCIRKRRSKKREREREREREKREENKEA
jgi:hypothetical protein